MSHLDFIIPSNVEDLLSSRSDSYWVRDVMALGTIHQELKRAKENFSNEGAPFILDKFEVYYSILHHGEKIEVEVINKILNDFNKVIQQLCSSLNVVLDDSEIAEEVRSKWLNVLKMTLYLYTSLYSLSFRKLESVQKQLLNIIKKGRRKGSKSKSEDELSTEEKKLFFLSIFNIMSKSINKLFDPPVCEESVINMVAEVCYTYLQTPVCKNEKELYELVFHLLGLLLKNYNHSLKFLIRIVQLIKSKENSHLELVVPEGIKIIVENFNCRGLVKDIVRELLEWQTNDDSQETTVSKQCSNILITMTSSMPELMMPEVLYLSQYLNYDSYALRNCILSIFTEVIVNVLAREEMNDDNREIRDQLLNDLLLHINDVNAHVRSKVLQNWEKLHSESAIPINKQYSVLEKASSRLKDKSVLVRKNAIALVTTFLKCNPFSACLDIDFYEWEVEKATKKYENLRAEFSNATLEDIKKKEAEWSLMKNDVRAVIAKKFEEESEDTMEFSLETPSEDLEELIRTYLSSQNYEGAFLICYSAGNKLKTVVEKRQTMEPSDKIEFYLAILHSIFNNMRENVATLVNEAINKTHLTQEQIEMLQEAENEVKYLNDIHKFLKLIESVIPQMILLLHSATISDLIEAVDFFVTAYQFKIKDCSLGLISMLSIMKSKEEDRKKAVTEAYQQVFLTSDNANTKDENLRIVKVFMELLKTMKMDNINEFTVIVGQLVKNGHISNNMIECLWHCYTKRIPDISNEDSKLALQLLMMTATVKKSIVERNINLITETAFDEKGMNDIHLVIIACRMLTLMGKEFIIVESEKASFRISQMDQMWDQLMKIIINNFGKNKTLYPDLITVAIEFIYKVCRKPDVICEKLIKNLIAHMKDSENKIIENDNIQFAHFANFNHLLGEVVIRQFLFLDIDIFRELKRRNYVREKRSKTQKSGTASLNNSIISASSRIVNTEEDDENGLQGAVADDSDAEFILHVCETEIVTKNLLGEFSPMLRNILKRPDKYDDEKLQSSTVLAFIRFMIVSSNFCEKNMQLIMTVLERTKYPPVKINILINMADLINRFPNIIEPWSPQIYKRLRDKDEKVRLTAITVVTTLIMQNMLRVRSTVADIALCITEGTPEPIKDVAKKFFNALSKNSNAIYNILPDVISRLSFEQLQVDEITFQQVLRFLIGLIDKDRIIEPLVEKLCVRFTLSEKIKQWRDLAFCLSLLNYSEKSLVRLTEGYVHYKISLEDEVVNRYFFSIIQKHKNSTKDEVKNAVRKLENLVKTGQEAGSDEEIMNVSNLEKSARKTKPLKSKRTKC